MTYLRLLTACQVTQHGFQQTTNINETKTEHSTFTSSRKMGRPGLQSSLDCIVSSYEIDIENTLRSTVNWEAALITYNVLFNSNLL